MSATQNIMRIIGSAAGGFAIPLLGLSGAFVAVAAVYVGAVVTTLMLRVATHERPAETGARAMLAGLVEGGRYAWAHTTIRAILLMSLIYFAFGMSYTQVFVPLFAENIMGIGAAGAGLMVSLTGAGALVSALMVASRQPTRVGLALPAIVWSFGLMLVAFAATSYLPGRTGLILPFIFITLTGATQTMFFSLSNAAMLGSAPAEMRGRIISLLSLDRGVMSLGGMGAGFLAEIQGVQIAQLVYGSVCVAGGLGIAILYKELRGMEIDPRAFEVGHVQAGRRGGVAAPAEASPPTAN
jgi:MFS transporter, DHA1 family, staphyloferrin A biosynthesis exporter